MLATPVPYYIAHFWQVCDAVEKHYGGLLTEVEHDYINLLRKLPLPAICLYVRLANRKGPYFRLIKLSYDECEPLESSVQLLMDAGLLSRCCPDNMPVDLQAVWSCFSHTELRRFFIKAPTFLLKFQCCDWLERQETESIGQLLAEHCLLCLHASDPWPFFKFLFFGELRDNLSGFVVRELGHIVTELLPEAELRPQFDTRGEAEHCFRMVSTYQLFRQQRSICNATELLAWWQAQGLTRDNLPQKALPVYDRLIDRLGKILERAKARDAALALYAGNPCSCRERYAKLLAKAGRKPEAIAICQQILMAPFHAEEAYAAEQLLGKLERNQRAAAARLLLREAAHITLERDNLNVEASVLRHYHASGWQGIHSENWLWNALFGLLLWDIIYDPGYGMFHHPLQMAPADLYRPGFYQRRADAIDARLTLLNDHDGCMAHLQDIHQQKQGVTNPFVYWQDDTLMHVQKLARYIPASALAAITLHMARDIKRHCRGFPDLFVWREDDYQLIEVKSVNDQLSPQQYCWLKFFDQQGVHVQALNVAFHDASPAIA